MPFEGETLSQLEEAMVFITRVMLQSFRIVSFLGDVGMATFGVLTSMEFWVHNLAI